MLSSGRCGKDKMELALVFRLSLTLEVKLATTCMPRRHNMIWLHEYIEWANLIGLVDQFSDGLVARSPGGLVPPDDLLGRAVHRSTCLRTPHLE